MFHVLELERKWRIENDLPAGFGSLSKFKPTVAVGSDRPLEEDDVFKADYFRKFFIYAYVPGFCGEWSEPPTDGGKLVVKTGPMDCRGLTRALVLIPHPPRRVD